MGLRFTNEDICGNCSYHKPHPTPEGTEWVCENQESEYYTDDTPYGFSCVDFEDRR